jgi:hypothetical protein
VTFNLFYSEANSGVVGLENQLIVASGSAVDTGLVLLLDCSTFKSLGFLNFEMWDISLYCLFGDLVVL